MRYAHIGTISHGTLRTEDLLPAFAEELEYYTHRNREELGAAETERLLALVNEAAAYYAEHEEDADELIDELRIELDQFAPPYCYFGALDGDGTDFGFWPCMDVIEELPDVEACVFGEDAKSVNDHGNVTVYAADGRVLLEIV